MTSGLANRSRRLIESGAIVYVLGFSTAGLFERAVSLGAMFCERLAMQVMYTVFPFLTKLEVGTSEYRHASGIVLRAVAWFTIPLAVLLVVLAAPFVSLVYGGNWNDVIRFVPAAVVLGSVAGISHVVYMLLLGNGQERRCLRADVLDFVGTIIALVVLLREGVMGYLAGLVVVRSFVFLYGAAGLLSSSGIARDALSKALGPAIVASAVAYAVTEGISTTLRWQLDEPAIATLYASSFVLVYLCSLRLLFRGFFVELVDYLPGKRTIGRFLLLKQSPI
jgi:O-antigen/teichoic acid export membrane protein